MREARPRLLLSAKSANPRVHEIAGRWLREGGMVVIRGRDRQERAKQVKQHAAFAPGRNRHVVAAFVESDQDGELVLTVSDNLSDNQESDRGRLVAGRRNA